MTILNLSESRKGLEKLMSNEFIGCTEKELNLLFEHSLKIAFREKGINGHHEERIYLSNMLLSFIRVDEKTNNIPYVIDLILNADNSRTQNHMKKRNADILLFTAGFFPEYFQKRGPGPYFYARHAGEMYTSYGINIGQNNLRTLFLNLGQYAPEFSECLKIAKEGFKRQKKSTN